MEENKKKRILAIDFGYSSVKIAYENEAGVLTLDKFISAIAKVPDPLDADNESMFQFLDSYYVIGGPALKVPRSFLLDMEDYESLEEIYPVMLSYIFNIYGGPEEWDHVIIGLSISFANKADGLLARLYEDLAIDRPGFFMCLPQGVSCRYSYTEHGLYLNDSAKKNDAKMRNYLIVDGGFLTIDATNIVNSKSAAGSTLGLAGTGVIRIARGLSEYLETELGLKVSIREAANIVDNNGIFNRRGKKYDVSEAVDRISKKYISDVLTLLEQRFEEDLDGAEGIVLCGGISHIVLKYLDRNDEELIKIIEEHYPVSFLKIVRQDSEFYNCVSYLRIAEKMLEKQNN